MAADLPAKAPAISPVATNWTGFYAGISGGWINMRTHISVDNPATTPPYSDTGAILGGTIGYNWQSASVVYGAEADLSWTSLKAKEDTFCLAPGCVTEVEWLGTVRGRAGFLMTPSVLLYGTGGAAIGSVHSYQHLVPVANFDYRYTKIGWTIGAGAEMQIWRNWSAKLEYLYYDLGDSGFHDTVVGAPQRTQQDAVRGNLVRIGLNYHF